MSNDHFTILQRRLTSEPWTLPHSPSPPLRQGKPIVLLTHEVHWRDAESRERDQKTFQRLFEQYQRAWHQRNVMQLFGLYASPSLARDRLHQVINQEPQGSLLLDSVNKHDISIFYSPTLTKTYQSRPVVRPTVPSYGVMGRTVNSFTKSNTDTAQDTATGPFVVMQMQIGEFAEHRLTLYWGQTAWGEWQLLTEVWSTLNS